MKKLNYNIPFQAKRLGFSLILACLALLVHGQVSVINTNNASSLAQKLSGPGVTVSNATVQCENQQSGIFTVVTSNLGLDSGIVLTTGRAGTTLPFYGVNGNEYNLANFNHGNGGDPDLTVLAGTTTHDRCILEFDFKANGDTVYFQYLFGSEEYPAYNCANYNDVFGFFISGPGYATPLNLALIPGTNIPVSINSINNGVISAGGNIANCTSMGPGSPFTSMYNTNVNGTTTTYSGFTDLLTSKASILPCSTYHLKLAIADGFDNIIDSGVFLKAGSLTSNSFELETLTDSVLNNQPYVHEGCDSAIIKIKRKFVQNSSVYADTVNMVITGTATNGVDYPPVQTTFVFTANPNDTIKTIYIEAFNDLITEGTEIVKLAIFDNCSNPVDSLSFLVKDPPKIQLYNNDTSICLGKSVQGNLVADPGFTFSWTPTTGVSNPTSMNPTFTPTVTTTYKVTAQYGNCDPIKDSFKITILPLPVQNISVTNPLCAGQTNGSLYITSSSTPSPLSFMLQPGNVGASGSPATFSNLGIGVYTVTVTNGNSCSKTNTATLVMPSTMSWTQTSATSIPCNSGNIGQITSSASGGTGVKTYSIFPGNTSNTSGTFNNLAAGTYTITVADANNCSLTTTISVTQNQGLSWVSVNSSNVFCFGFTDGSITVQATGTSSNITYALTPGGTSNTTGVFNNLGTNTYTVTASDPGGCTLSTSVVVTSPPGGLVFNSATATNLNCANQPIGTISVTASGGTAPLTYLRQPGNVSNSSGNFTALTFGTYSISVTDANGCSLSTTVVVTSPPAITYTITVTPPTCVPGNNGVVVINATGGVPGYTYSLGGPYQSSNTYTNVTFGPQTVYIKDANGCTKSYAINPPNPSPITITNSTLQLTCTDSITDIVVTANNGVPPYQYTLLPQNITNATGTFYNFGQGTYTVKVLDAVGCSKSIIVSLVPPQLTWQQFLVSNIPCTGIGSGSLACAIQGGTQPISFNLTPPNITNSTGTFNNLSVNQYTVLATDATGCTVQSVFNIVVSPPFSFPTPNITNVNCFSFNSGVIQVIPSGGINPFSYIIQPTAVTNTNGVFTGLAAGTYTISATDGSGCSNSVSATVTQNPLITIAINTIPPNCSPGGNGSITVNPSGGSGTFTYKLNTGSYQNGNVFGSLNNGTYTITVKDGVNCTKSTIVQLQNPSYPTITALNPSLIVCNGGTSTLTTVVNGATNPVSYSISPNPQTNNTGIFSGLTANTYTVLVSDGNNCTTSSTVTITQSPAMSWLNTTMTPITCNGQGNGQIAVTANGGNGAYTYTRTPGNMSNSSGVFTGLSNITYVISATDANGCTLTTAIAVTQPNFLSWTGQYNTNILCHGQSTGAIQNAINGGTPPYNYTLNPGALTNNTGQFNNLNAGNYTLTGTDANGCSIVTTVNLNQPALLQISNLSNTIPSCVPGNDGTISVSVSGGLPAYQYSLNNGANQVSSTFQNIGVSVYTVTVTDFNGCQASSTINVINPGVPSFSSFNAQNLACYNIPTGSVNAIASGGTGQLTYAIQPLGLSNLNGNFSALAANNYTVSVTDGNGCSATSNVIISQPPQLLWDSVDNRDVSCYNGSNGLVTSSASGGTGTLSYYLAPVGIQNFSGSFFGLGTGNYTLSVTDSNGCSIQSAFAINQFPQILWSNPQIQTVSCHGGSNGGFTTTASGGAGSFDYQLLPAGPNNTNGQFSNLSAGTYTILTTDANNCTATTAVTVTQPNPVSVSNVVPTFATCNPGCDGSANITGTGGTGPYQFAINGGTYQTSSAFSNLCSGGYTVTIKDANNCTATSLFTITTANGPSAIQVNPLPATCNGLSNGSMTVVITGANGTVNYLLQPGAVTNTNGAFVGLSAGSYTVLATDASGCTISSIASINQPATFLIDSFALNQITCFGGNNGSFSTFVSGGSSGFTYSLIPSGATNNNGNFSALTAGTFTVQVSDANGCTTVSSTTLNQPLPVNLSMDSSSQIACYNGNNGAIYLSATGGNGSFSFTLQNPLSTNNNGQFTSLSAGTYTATATDISGCTGSTVMTLTQPPLLQITSLSATIPSCIPGNDAMITVTAAGGTSPFSYSINGGTYQTANTFNAIGIGNYIITIKDANDCTVSSNIAVTSPNSPTITSMSATLATCNPGCDASISLTASGGTGALQYAINGGAFQNNTVFNNLCANNYTVVVSDVVGCTYSSQISVNTVNGPVLTNVAVNQIPCYGAANGSISLTVSGGTSPLNYTLNPGSVVNNNGVFNALSPNTYNVQVVDANGCSIVTATTIVQPTQMQFSNVSSTSALCNGVNNGSISFVFSGGTGTSNFTILPAGTFTAPNSFTGLAGNQTYTLTATDANGCTVSAINTVAQPPSLIIDSVSSTAVTCNGANNGSIQISASGGSGQITYTMTPGGLSNTTGTFVNLPGNIFTITATDANGCSISTSVSIINPSSLLIANASATDVICFGQNNGSISLLAGGGIGMISYQLLPVNVSNSTGQFPALGPGTYDAVALDANGCSDTVQLIVNEPALVQFTSVIANGVLCSGQNNGALTVAAAGGVGVISYTVQPGGQSNTTGIFNSLSGNQTYTVTASDVNGCTTVTTVFVVLPSAMSIDSVNQINVDCFGAGNGMVLMTVSGGTGLINYALNPGAIINQTGIFSNLNGNVYVITATDANGCSLSTTFNVTEPTALQFSTAASTNIICFGQVNGSVSVTASGGVSSYTYSMNPGNLSNQNGSFTGLLSNVYTTTVTDANNCTLSTTLVVIEPPLVKFDSVQKQNVKCFGQSNASIQAFASGGVGPLNYSITPQPSTNTTGLFNGLPTGSYTITISDSKGCTAMTTVNIFQPQPLVETLVSTSNVTCYGGNDGSIVVSASGGTQPYLFNLQPVNVSSSLGNYPAVSAGVYTMYVSDFNGCQDSIPGIVITQPTPIVFTSVTHEDITCYYDTTGSISVQAQGGTGALVFTLTPQKGIQSSWGQFDNLSGGPYTVTAIDASGCTVTTLVVIKQNLEIVASDVQLNQPICHGDANGSIYISAVGGVAPLTYSMNGGPFINPGIYLNLVAGTYAFTIMDALGCVKDTSLILTEPDIVHGDIEIEDILCPGKADGIVRVKGTGGRADYTYYLKPGLKLNKNGNFYNLEVGEYTLTVKDSSNCVFDTVIQIKEADNAMSLNFDKKNLGCFGFGNEGWAEVKVSGGTPPFTYAWNTSPVMTDARIENLRYGYYQVNVSDANGCEVSDKVYIEPGPCCEEVYLPNAFSPNNDGKNDEWRVVTSVGLELIQLVIYNRWGNKVWETYDIAKGWDGTYRGDKMDTETYFYLFRYKCLHDGKNYTKKGDIILLR